MISISGSMSMDKLPEWVTNPLKSLASLKEKETKLNGKEIETKQHDDGHWTATEGALEGKGANEDEAQRDLLRIKAESPGNPVVSQLTQTNKAKVMSTFDGQASKLIVQKLRNAHTYNGKKCDFVAYYNDDPDNQGYGETEVAARLDLFSKKKG